jgi:hypothetical protein
MRFARYAFFLAGLYGLLIMPLMYFMESRFGQGQPPRLMHPEFFYGFVGVVIAWQIAFLMIAYDPKRYQLIMLAAWIEKFSFALATIVLYFQKRAEPSILAFGLIDFALGVLFVAAFLKTSQDREQGWKIGHRDRTGNTESSGPLI